MVGKINPNNDPNNNIPPNSGDLSFQHDYTSPQQRVMNEHIHELKNLLKTGDINDPEVKQHIAQLRHQIQYKDLPAVGLSERRRPTVADAMQYIDQQSGYTTHVENAAKAVEQVSVSKKSKKSSWRQLAGSAQATPTTKTSMLKTKGAKAPDDLNTISTNFQTWLNDPAHATDKKNNQNIFNEISNAIAAFKQSPSQNSGASLRAFIQSDTNLNSCTKELFNTSIYGKLSNPNNLNSLFNALNFDSHLLPSQTKESGPQPKPGYTVYLLKNLPKGNTVTITGSSPGIANGYVTIDPKTQVGVPTATPTTLTYSQFPQFNGQPYIYMPNGTSNGRITFGDPKIGAHPTFCEFTASSGGTSPSYVNFTAVDTIPSQTLNIQMTTDSGSSSRNGIPVDHDTFVASMTALYGKYDKTGVWASTMKNDDGSIKSGKFMNDPRITGTGSNPPLTSLAGYLTGTFIPGITPNAPLNFMSDDGTLQKGWFTRNPNTPSGWNFTTQSGTSMPVPPLTDIGSWFSGSDAGWNSNPPGPGGQRPPMNAVQWGITKALSGLMNVGIPPNRINSTVGNNFFTSLENVKNFYQAPFYNMYRRVVHESGCNAYASDYDDVLGGDGTLSAPPSDHPFFTITFGGSTPAFDPSAAVDKLWSYTQYGSQPIDIPQEYMRNATNFQNQMALYTAEVAKYNKMSPQQKAAEWPNLQSMYNVTFQGYNLSTGYNFLFGDGPGIASDEVCRIIGIASPMTREQATAIGQVMDDRYLGSAPVLPAPPGPPGPPPITPATFMSGREYMSRINKWMSQNGDTDTKPGHNIYTIVSIPLSSEAYSSPNITMQDIQKWWQTPGPGQTALTYLTSPSIYNTDQGLKQLMASDPTGKQAQAALQGLFDQLSIPGQVPTPPGPPPTQTIDQYKQALLTWLGDTGHDANQYLRTKFINTIFGMIDRRDGQRIKTVGDMLNWLNNGPGKGMMAALVSPQIYANDPGLTQGTLQDLFKTLGLTAPVPTPPGPPTPPDLAALFKLHPDINSLYHNNEVVELKATLKGEGQSSHSKNVINLMTAHKANYIAALKRDGYSPADQATLADALSIQEWKDAGGIGTYPLGT